MQSADKIEKLIAGGTVGLLCACVLYASGPGILEEWKANAQERMQMMAEQTYMTGLTYLNREKTEPGSKIVQCAFQLLPLGGYVDDKVVYTSELDDKMTNEMILAMQEADEIEVDEKGKLSKEDEKKQSVQEASEEAKKQNPAAVEYSMEQLKNFDYLTSHFYTVDSSTFVNPEDLQAEKLLATNMKLDRTKKGPKILLYHTHSQEAFVDSVPGDVNTTIVGMGRLLAQLLNEKYGIETLHHEGIYDMENGHVDRSRAYERAKPAIQKILKENPSIEMVIDLHRDGVREDTHLVTDINGKPTAKIMFFNGLSRTRTNGKVMVLENPYIQNNLALSLQMKLAAEKKYPGFTRKIYLKGYRYNMHFKPKNMLIEGGAQTNTVEEMRNAMVLLAELINDVVG